MTDVVPGYTVEDVEAVGASLGAVGDRMRKLARSLSWFGENGTAAGGDRPDPLYRVTAVTVAYGGGLLGFGAARDEMLAAVNASLVSIETALIASMGAELTALLEQYGDMGE